MMKRLPNDCFFSLVEDDIHHGKSVRFRMKGSSMFPLLREGKDEVAVYPCKAESLKPMDVVLFRYRGRCLLHRIVGMKDGRFIMQGDGVCAFYEECTAADIIGVLGMVSRFYKLFLLSGYDQPVLLHRIANCGSPVKNGPEPFPLRNTEQVFLLPLKKPECR